MATETAAPEYIDVEDYAGPFTIEGISPRHFAGSATAGTIAAHLGREGVIWESFGTPRGSRFECFARSRFVADEAGNLHVYSAKGAKVITHPSSRRLRILQARP